MKIQNIYLKLFTRHNVGQQLRSLFIVTILVPMLCLAAVILMIASHQLTQKYERLSEIEANQIRSVFVTTTLYLREVCENLAADEQLQELLAASYDNASAARMALSRYTGFSEALNHTASISDLKLYVDADTLCSEDSFSYYMPVTAEIQQQGWYQRFLDSREDFWESALRTDRSGVDYWELNYYCHIPVPEKSSYALLVVSVSNDYLRNLIQDSDGQIYVSANDGPVFFCSDRSYPGNPLPVSVSSAESFEMTGKITLQKKRAIASLRTLQPVKSSDSLYIVAANPSALADIRDVELLILLCIVFVLLLSITLISLFSRYFSDRIQTLRLAMHKISNNDYEIVNSILGDDELSATFRDLKSMVTRLKENEAQIYQAEIKEQKLSNQQQQMELKLLSNQINPHFLYNTLETIRMKAFTEGNREVANAIKLLGKSMRYVLGTTRITATTLDKELEYITTYLAIQKLRFAERLDYRIETDPALNPAQYQILPLLIQPLVENAISHGLEPTGNPGCVTLHLQKSADGLLIVSVSDNGCGMDEERLAFVRAHLNEIHTGSGHGVGLSNINSRIRLYYGTQYGLSIESSPGHGTCTSFCVPLYNLREEE